MVHLDAVLRGGDATQAVARFHWDPIACGRWMTRRFGGAVGVAKPWAGRRAEPYAYFISGADNARAVFDAWDDLRPTGLWPVKAPRRTVHERLRFNFLCLAGQRHGHYARQISAPFRRDAVDAEFARQRRLVRRELRRLQAGAPLDLSEVCRRIATICVFDAVFGERDAERALRIGELLQSYHEQNWSRAAILLPARIPGSPYARVLATAERVKEEVGAWLDEGAEGDPERSLRAALAQLRDEDGRPISREFAIANLCTIAWAAFDTPWLALLWTLTHLGRNPDASAALREALQSQDAFDDASVKTLAGVSYLNGAIYEALRLSPPAPFIGLRAARDTAVGGVDLRRGATLFLSVYETHRDPRAYRDPEAFRPERWPDKAPNAYSFIAFSGGVRRCPGYSYSLMFLRMALTEIYRRFDLEFLTDEEIRTRAAPTLAPLEPVTCWLMARARAGEPAREREAATRADYQRVA